MKEIGLFFLFLILMIGTNGLLDWLYGVSNPWKPMLATLAVMRPSEYVVIAAMMLVIFIAALKKPFVRILGRLFSMWVRFMEASDLPSAFMNESGEGKQQRKNSNK